MLDEMEPQQRADYVRREQECVINSRARSFEQALSLLVEALEDPDGHACGLDARAWYGKAQRRWKELDRARRKYEAAGGELADTLAATGPFGLLPGPLEMALSHHKRLMQLAPELSVVTAPALKGGTP